MPSRFAVRQITFALAGWHTLLHPRRRPSAAPQRILVAQDLLLGDTLMLTPLLAKLRLRHPEAEIVMTTSRAMLPLYEKHPYGVIAAHYDERDISSLWRLHETSGYDMAIVPAHNRHSWLARALDARWIVAHAGDRPAYKNWPVDELTPYPDMPATLGDMFAAMIPGAPPPPYDIAQWPAPEAKPFTLPGQPYCVLHVGASNVLKLWPPERWLALADRLVERGYQVVWSGGRGEQAHVDAIDPHHRYLSYAGCLDLAQLWCLFDGASLLVCPDTGVAHLGRIVGTPTVTLFGPGSPLICGKGEFWKHARYEAVIIDDIPCRDGSLLFNRQVAWAHFCSRSPQQCAKPICMEAIDLSTVWHAVMKVTATS